MVIQPYCTTWWITKLKNDGLLVLIFLAFPLAVSCFRLEASRLSCPLTMSSLLTITVGEVKDSFYVGTGEDEPRGTSNSNQYDLLSGRTYPPSALFSLAAGAGGIVRVLAPAEAAHTPPQTAVYSTLVGYWNITAYCQVVTSELYS